MFVGDDSARYKGRVSIYIDPKDSTEGWGTINGKGISIVEGNVICRQLGYTKAKEAYNADTHNGYVGINLFFLLFFFVMHADSIFNPREQRDTSVSSHRGFFPLTKRCMVAMERRFYFFHLHDIVPIWLSQKGCIYNFHYKHSSINMYSSRHLRTGFLCSGLFLDF